MNVSTRAALASLLGFLLSDMGAWGTPLMYAFREREKILDLFESLSGSRYSDTLIGDDNDNWIWALGPTNGVTPTNDNLYGFGGNDSNNMIVPVTDFAQYDAVRSPTSNVALSATQLVP